MRVGFDKSRFGVVLPGLVGVGLANGALIVLAAACLVYFGGQDSRVLTFAIWMAIAAPLLVIAWLLGSDLIGAWLAARRG